MKCEVNAAILPDAKEIEALTPGVCPVDWAKGCVEKAREENCGKNVMCRDGMTQLLAILSDLVRGKGESEDLELLRDLAQVISTSPGCALAAKAAGNLLYSLDRYPEIWESHLRRKRCPAGVCEALAAQSVQREKRRERKRDRKLDADIIVVAAGLSGLTAATQAAENGAKVLVFEKSSTTGGAANMGMAFFAVESKYQRDQMYEWTRDQAFNEFMEYTHWKADAKLVRRWFNMSADTVEWVESFGVEFLGAYKYFKDSHLTQHMIKIPGATKPAERQASRMVKLMTDYATELGVDFRFRTPVKRLLTGEKGQVIGVVAAGEDGVEREYYSDAVIVGTGGIGNNVEMIKQHLGWTWGKDMFTFRIPGIDGDGMNMVWAIGGKRDRVSMEVTYNTPGTTDVFKTLSEAMRQPSTIMVNIEGERIINEEIMENTTFTGNAISQQTGMRAFTIIGSDGIDYMRKHGLDYITYHHAIKDLDKWDSEKQAYFAGEAGNLESSVFGAGNGVSYREEGEDQQQNFYECGSIEEISRVTGINYENLKKTIERYNSFAGGYDADFVKAPRYLRPITGEKFYVARHFPSGYGSLGGIKVNYRMEVLDTENRPIPGLYGCGTDTAGVFAGEYCFYNPGSTMSYALNSGRIAAAEARDYIDGDSFVE